MRSRIHLINAPQGIAAPLRYRVAALEVADPVEHQPNGFLDVLLELGLSGRELLSDLAQDGRLVRHVEYQQDAEAVLGPAEQVRDQAFLAGWRR